MSPIACDSNDPKTAAIQGTQKGNGGTGVLGIGVANGVIGQSTGGGFSGVFGESTSGPGVSGSSTTSVGVDAKTKSGPAALRAVHEGNGVGVLGVCKGSGSSGVHGESATGPGVSGASNSSVGVDAKTKSGPAALRAVHEGNGVGVLGVCKGSGSSGVHGESATGPGVSGASNSSVGVDAKTQTGPAALRAVHTGNGVAGLFKGDVRITQDLHVEGDIYLGNADCAEDFDVADAMVVEAGTVMVLNDAGAVMASDHAYDRRVAGVVSGAGAYKPGIILDKRETGAVRQPIALLGKVFCKVDAQFQPIQTGDLLTTSPTPGHAMAAKDPIQAFGAVIGKAMKPMASGQGLIPVLIALQ